MATLFPSLKPPITNKIWFTVDQNGVVESDASLTKQELEFSLEIKEEVNKGRTILPLGKEKDKIEDHGLFYLISKIDFCPAPFGKTIRNFEKMK